MLEPNEPSTLELLLDLLLVELRTRLPEHELIYWPTFYSVIIKRLGPTAGDDTAYITFLNHCWELTYHDHKGAPVNTRFLYCDPELLDKLAVAIRPLH